MALQQPEQPEVVDSFIRSPVGLLVASLALLAFYLYLLYLLQPTSEHQSVPEMVSQKVWDLCHADRTVSSELARDPTLAPSKVIKHLYSGDAGGHDEHEKVREPYATADDLGKAYGCGKWGNTRPSELFLKVYAMSHP